MNICNSGHDELCYVGWSCPACALQEKVEELETELREAQE